MGLCFCFRRPSSQCGRGSTPASRQVQVHLFLGVARLVATNMWFRVCAKLLIRAGTDPEASDGGSGGVCVSASAQCRTMQPEADVQRKHPKEQAGVHMHAADTATTTVATSAATSATAATTTTTAATVTTTSTGFRL